MIDFEMAAANQFARLLNPRVDFITPYTFIMMKPITSKHFM